MDTQNHKNFKPYKGLQPYEEENKDIFFGRDAERNILIDKILSNKLTLLFAASGVGKSSLLRAAILPELERADKENLDVIYYKDWVPSESQKSDSMSDPGIEIKRTVLQILQKRKKTNAHLTTDKKLSLQKFFHICSMFSSKPMVVILDQFEEFFQYWRFQEGFKEFVKQIAESFNDRQTPVVFVISMREDFALELNAFKSHLSTTLFKNFFRLEKLKREQAVEAIEKPLQGVFKYEEGLVDKIIDDLSGQKNIQGKKSLPIVEPPYLQIVCTHLWNKEKDNPEKKIRLKTYQDSGNAKGIVGSYFEKEISSFSVSEKRIASKAFDHLVTTYGTKIAYPARDLSGKISENEQKLEKVLEKLQQARILRKQKREGIVWYELYHDVFSKIIYEWNEKYKEKQRIKRAFQITGLFLLACLLLYVYFNMSHHLRLSAESGNMIEVFRGKSEGFHIFGFQEYEAEMSYEKNQLEPDKLFSKKNIADYKGLNNELIGHFSITNRVDTYWKSGEAENALKLADMLILPDDMYRTEQIIDVLADFRSERSIEILRKHLNTDTDSIREIIASALGNISSEKHLELLIILLNGNENKNVIRNAVEALGKIRSDKAVKPLTTLLENKKNELKELRRAVVKALGDIGTSNAIQAIIIASQDKSESEYVKIAATEALGNIATKEVINPLIICLKDQYDNVRASAASALGNIGDKKAVDDLIALLIKQSPKVIEAAASALGNIGDKKAVDHLIPLLQNHPPEVIVSAVSALGNIGDEKAFDPLIRLLHHQDTSVRSSVSPALGNIGSERAIKQLILFLGNSYPPDVRCSAASALGEIGSEKAVDSLIALLKDKNEIWSVKSSVALALGSIGSEKVVEPLIDMLEDKDVKRNAASALGEIGSEKAVAHLIPLLNDTDAVVKGNAVSALGNIGSDKAIEYLIPLLNDTDVVVRGNAVSALGNIGSDKAIEYLIPLLKDQSNDVKRNAAGALAKIGIVTISSLQNYSYIKSGHNIPKQEVILQKAKSKERELPKTIGGLKAIATEKTERVPIRLAAITELGNIKTEEAVDLLLHILETEDSSYQFRAIQALGNIGNSKALPNLFEKLKELADRKSEWRKIRDENTDSYTEPQMEDWRKRLESVKPKPYLECELAYAIARIAPDTEGIRLLNHDLAAVREGAWLGIGKVGTVELLRKLYEERRRKDISPWFRHAAYRAIDHVLIHLEAFGSSNDADELEKFLSQVPEKDEPGVHTRTKWTMDRLREAKNEK